MKSFPVEYCMPNSSQGITVSGPEIGFTKNPEEVAAK
jgi:hypothetical protein